MLAQITDPHIGARWSGTDPLDTLGDVLRRLGELPAELDGVLLTGDLANDGTDAQYEQLAGALAASPAPVHVLAGNHDDRARLRAHLDVPGEGSEPIQYALSIGGLRVLMLDTTIPGEGAGALGAERLGWIAEALAAEPDAPTLIAMHHPPLLTGLPGFDVYRLHDGDRSALTELLNGHPQVRGVVAGHVHRTITFGVAGRPGLTIPSTYCQLPLDVARAELPTVAQPLGFAVHSLVEGRLVSHVQTLALTA